MTTTFSLVDLWYASPLLVVVATGLVLLILEALRFNNKTLVSGVALSGLAGAVLLTVITAGESQPAFQNTFLHGTFGGFFSLLFLAAGVLSILMSGDYLERLNIRRTEYFVLMLFAIAGMILMASALDLVILFLGVELMSLCLYVLAGFSRTRQSSNEASLKYFLLGAFATGFLLYGIALIYGATGSTSLATLGGEFSRESSNGVLLLGVGLVMMALAFKVAAAPFHMWAPDVYEGAPTSVTGFMATAAKAAAFAALVAVFGRSLAIGGTNVGEVFGILAVASMIVGNIAAIAQSSVKRMLAYSGIAHAGYMLAGVAAGNPEGQIGIMYYIVAYVLMNLGVFAIVSLVEGEDGSKLSFEDYAGFSRQQPLLAMLLSVFMFSLAGIPPFAGFFGKYYVFLAAVKADMTWLAIAGVLTSVISVYYYLRLVVLMYFREGSADVSARPTWAAVLSISVAAYLVIQFGMFPSIIVDAASQVF